MYGNFAGRDASRGMAKQSFDEGKSTIQGPCPRLIHVDCRNALTHRGATGHVRGSDSIGSVSLGSCTPSQSAVLVSMAICPSEFDEADTLFHIQGEYARLA
jgi:hypothetical protein